MKTPRQSAIGFARSVVHYRTGKRIYPKTAKAFPLRGKRNDRRQMKLVF